MNLARPKHILGFFKATLKRVPGLKRGRDKAVDLFLEACLRLRAGPVKARAFAQETARWRRIRAGKEPAPETYNGKRILSPDEGNRLIAEAIATGRPFMVGRYGSLELDALWRVGDGNSVLDAPLSYRLMDQFYNIAGFFPKDKALVVRFAEEMKRATAKADLIFPWFNPMEEYELGTWGGDVNYSRWDALEPFSLREPWTQSLKGKRVLVIHPYFKTIPAQYAKRRLLFPDPDFLPEFELVMQRAVQTNAGNVDGRFRDWFEALDFMTEEALSRDFDVALIGCGAYGFPLAARLKRAGKTTIHIGGALQIFFGIRGRRWEAEGSPYLPFMNEHWVRPAPEETPEGIAKVEGGCYW